MNNSNKRIETVVKAALTTYLGNSPFSSGGYSCEVKCGGFRAKVYAGADATIRIVIYDESNPEEDR